MFTGMLGLNSLRRIVELLKTTDTNKILMLAIQGCSTSGKSTIAEVVYSFVQERSKNYKPFLFSTDCFFKTRPFITTPSGTTVHSCEYDYDNPGALDWTLISECMKSIANQSSTINYSFSNFEESKRYDVMVQNTGYNSIILEGIYGHALLCPFTYNTAEFDPCNPSKIIKHPFVINEHYSTFIKKFKIIPIFLDVSDEIILQTRIKVDKARADWPEEKSIEYTKKYVLPSTRNYVRHLKFPHSIEIRNGSRNEEILDYIQLMIQMFDVTVNKDEIANKLNEKIGMKIY